MDNLLKKINELMALAKAINASTPAIPAIPAIKPPPPPSMKAPQKNKKIPGMVLDSKKDPRKVAQQIKDGSMSTKTQKIMLKGEECLKIDQNGQWSLEKGEKDKEQYLYHIHEGPHRITSKPLSLEEIKAKHGSVQKLENNGFRLIRHIPEIK